MSTQPPLPAAPVAGAVSIGQAVALVEDGDGGRVFLRGELVYAWSAGDVPPVSYTHLTLPTILRV